MEVFRETINMSFDLDKANVVKSLILTRAQAGATINEIKGIVYCEIKSCKYTLSVAIFFFLNR